MIVYTLTFPPKRLDSDFSHLAFAFSIPLTAWNGNDNSTPLGVFLVYECAVGKEGRMAHDTPGLMIDMSYVLMTFREHKCTTIHVSVHKCGQVQDMYQEEHL